MEVSRPVSVSVPADLTIHIQTCNVCYIPDSSVSQIVDYFGRSFESDTKADVSIVKFGRRLRTETIRRQLAGSNLQPVSVGLLLSIGIAQPHLLEEGTLVGLGALHADRLLGKKITWTIALKDREGSRYLTLEDTSIAWEKEYWFPCVHLKD